MNFILLIEAVSGISILIFIALLIIKWINEGKLEEFMYNYKRNKFFRFGKPRTRHYFIGAVYLIVFIVIAYLIISSLNPKSSGTYEINADNNFLSNSISSFYINPSSVLGEKIQINGQDVRPITSQQTFGLVFKPKTIVSNNQTGTLEINFLTNGEGSEIYLNNNLIIPNFDNYEKIAGYTDNDVYIKKSFLESYDKELEEAENAGDFLYNNFPGTSVYTQSILKQSVPDIQDYKQETTKISTTFRGDLKLAVYADNDLKVDFTKQDLNGYLGDDEYSVNITDINGKMYFTKTYEDDGDRKNTNKLGKEQVFNIDLGNLSKGVYFISFTKDKNNDAPDSSLKNIKVNSNKVLLVGNVLPWSNFNFYTKTTTPKTISFNYWHTNKNQTIQISGAESKTIKLDKDWLSKTYTQNLTIPGDYNVKTSTGYLWVYADYLSIGKDNWFDMPITSNAQKFANQDIIILDTNKVSINENSYKYKTDISVEDLKNVKMKVLEPNKIYLKDIKFSI